ncbi:Uu.00g054310.m01.CDS01 [Anthostomella pinea]|uniref:Uu.00g054310.m01.CDS01 n=1 Tax=Anthostomella pinea TaxID=933095 RepID=A0AAI8VQW5_9PEZI|nr:Uu.00g054310.m01.CDS01 [Anthostomella pinea]
MATRTSAAKVAGTLISNKQKRATVKHSPSKVSKTRAHASVADIEEEEDDHVADIDAVDAIVDAHHNPQLSPKSTLSMLISNSQLLPTLMLNGVTGPVQDESKNESAETQFSFACVWASDEGALTSNLDNAVDEGSPQEDTSIWETILKVREEEHKRQAEQSDTITHHDRLRGLPGRIQSRRRSRSLLEGAGKGGMRHTNSSIVGFTSRPFSPHHPRNP